MKNLFIFFLFFVSMVVPLGIFIHGYIKYSRESNKRKKLSAVKIKYPTIRKLLNEKFPYFNKLPEKYKNEFCQRTVYFANRFNWIPGDKNTITDEMKILISATAIQLTFGLKNIDFQPYQTIVVFAEAYYNNMTHRYHKGEVNERYIILSWKYFKEGIEIEDDKINLGLHELAHALDLSNVLSKGRRFYLSRLMEHFRKVGAQEYFKLRHGSPSFLRSYGGTNLREFFSVAAEHFFEAPQQFKELLPSLYDEMCLLLNQDPAVNIYRGVETNRFYKQKNEISKEEIYKLNTTASSVTSPSILIPFISSAFLALPVYFMLTFLVSVWVYMDFRFFPVVLIFAFWITAKQSISGLLIKGNYLIIKKPLDGKEKLISIALSNILYVDFTVYNIYERTEITYMDRTEVKTYTLKMYYSSPSILQIKKSLMQNSILIRQNKIWTKPGDIPLKESPKINLSVDNFKASSQHRYIK